MRWGETVTWATGKIHTEFLWGDLMKRGPFGDLSVNERIILK
jgi:hypothetical protein